MTSKCRLIAGAVECGNIRDAESVGLELGFTACSMHGQVNIFVPGRQHDELPVPRQLTAVKPCRLHAGFTLLEMVLVLFIVVLGFSAIGLSISSGNDAARIQAAARDLVSALRFAKGQSLISHKEVTVDLDLNANTYTVDGRDKVFEIPENVSLTVVTAQEELNGDGLASIRFFPDGSSTGGRIKLERDAVLWQIDINWLTGQIELENK